VDAAHNVTDTGTRIVVGSNAFPYFGVDEITTDPSGLVLVHVPPAAGAGTGHVAVIDPATNTVIHSIPIPGNALGGGIAVTP
jgi:DNA-binding beta-propeller fold protein YncE